MAEFISRKWQNRHEIYVKSQWGSRHGHRIMIFASGNEFVNLLLSKVYFSCWRLLMDIFWQEQTFDPSMFHVFQTANRDARRKQRRSKFSLFFFKCVNQGKGLIKFISCSWPVVLECVLINNRKTLLGAARAISCPWCVLSGVQGGTPALDLVGEVVPIS